MFDGGKWRRQHYFNFIFEIEVQFLELLIFSSERAEFLVLKSQSCHTLELDISVNQNAACDLKSPKMSNDDDKQSNYRLMNVLYRTKAIDLWANLQGNKR